MDTYFIGKRYSMDLNVLYIVLLIFVFLITVTYLDKSNYCQFGFRAMLADSATTGLTFVMIIVCMIFVFKIYSLNTYDYEKYDKYRKYEK